MDFTSLIGSQNKIPEIDPSIFDKYHEVNRLIIIGNGFDLAHGLKTSFKDFIEDYCLQILNGIREEGSFEDKLISVTNGARFHHHFPDFDSYSPNMAYKKLRAAMNGKGLESKIKSELLKNIFSEIEAKTWADIELIFFKMLKGAAQNPKAVTKLNMEMDFLKSLLKNYLLKEVEKNKPKPISKIHQQFKEKIKKNHSQPFTVQKDKNVKSTCVLNFNYTNTPELYFGEFLEETYQHIKIHGGLDGNDISSQGPVFGFGDELDEEYLKFENMENDELFKHIKSFKYLQFQSYRSLLEFIESSPFQVQVYGHSLGLSDRTLLNTIFEHENCISIKLFYHKRENGDDYEQKTFAISRHFRSKSALRSKVVNKKYSEPMGQKTHNQKS
ncbi:bacteriophage abortive infection AbiH family protein [Algoriphagus limi]|uniref:Bacteriophage abortive infection AbiH family protein n=1 Tax=Algoriphagus limi TaxID=2975273 RepID=A0ABT2G221_9BACT|nr:bacteriophage abortive infection AbiH family protein [Algoriphagus limi]MCS5489302.1 bacteriophage abortive infection AbiH family protein [Algoriphagus limi]